MPPIANILDAYYLSALSGYQLAVRQGRQQCCLERTAAILTMTATSLIIRTLLSPSSGGDPNLRGIQFAICVLGDSEYAPRLYQAGRADEAIGLVGGRPLQVNF